MGFTDIVALLGGVALFLFGMTSMGDALKSLAGNKMETYLYKLSSTPVKGFFLGILVAAVIQSSAATSVMVISFVNAGMMAFSQGLCIMLGSCIGTTMTSWILSLSGAGASSIFSVEVLYSLFIFLGVLTILFIKKQTYRQIGQVFVGLGMLLLAMHLISESVDPLTNNPEFQNILIEFDSNPLLGLLAGILVAGVVQSCSAAIGILQAVSLTCDITLNAALPIILGMNIGASVPVLFAMLSSNKNGKRCSLGYLFFNVVGAALVCLLYYPIQAIWHLPVMDMLAKESSIAIPIVNTLIRVVAAAILVPGHKLLEKIIFKVVPVTQEEKADEEAIDNLSDTLLAFAPAALEQSRIAVDKMAELSIDNLFRAIQLLFNFDRSTFAIVDEKESVVDRYEDKLGNFIVQIGQNPLDRFQQATVSSLLSAIGDFERLSDHSLNLAEVAEEISEKKIIFSQEAQKEIDVLVGAVEEILALSKKAFLESDVQTAYMIEPLEQVIDDLCKQLKVNHIERLQKNDCTIIMGFVFNDLLTNLERVSDHCANVGFNVLHKNNMTSEEHIYSEEISTSQAYLNQIKIYRKKYSLT